MVLGYLLTVPDLGCDMLTGMHLEKCAIYSNIYDLNLVNPLFKFKSKKYNLSGTYDGFIIVSEKFKTFCENGNYSGLEFINLPNNPGYFWFKINNILNYDVITRKTKFLNYSISCNGYEEVIGATPVYLLEKKIINDGFFRTDICFGSFAGKSPLVLLGEVTKVKLLDAGFKEIYFEKIEDHYNF